jgi:hypothetical protein
VISDTQFLAKEKSYDKDGVTNSLQTKVRKYVTMDTFTPEAVGKVSITAAALCTWVNANKELAIEKVSSRLRNAGNLLILTSPRTKTTIIKSAARKTCFKV